MMWDRTARAGNERELTALLSDLDRRLRELRQLIGEAHFTQYADKKRVPELAALEEQLSQLLLFPGLYETVGDWLPRASTPELRAELRVLSNRLSHARVARQPHIVRLERELADRHIEHRYEFSGRPSSLGELREVLRQDPDRERRHEAWLEIARPHSCLAEDMKRLISLRNEAASELGFNSFVDAVLEGDGLSRSEVEHVLGVLATMTATDYRQCVERGMEQCGLDDLHPWDVQYVLSRSEDLDPRLFPKGRLTDTLSGWCTRHGLDLEQLGIRFEVVDIPYNGLCMFIHDRDIRILANPSDGYPYYRTLFHELGHAIHAASINRDRFVFRWDASLFHEVMAETFGHITREAGWLQWFGLSEQQQHSLLSTLVGPALYGIRQRSAYALFEYRLYDDPTADADALLDEVEREFVGSCSTGHPRWSANAWYASYPVYWQNYVLADAIASQIHATIRARHGGLDGHPDAIAHVRSHYMAPGASVPWRQKLITDTGSDIDPSHLATALAKLSRP